jgi:hypothetical protein
MNKKVSFLTIALWATLICFMLNPQISMGKMTSLTEDELSEITAQAGIAIEVDHVDFSSKIDTIYYHDKDGHGDSDGAYLSFNDIDIEGSVHFDTPMTVGIETTENADGQEVTGINMNISDMTIDLDHFVIDSITVGSAPGEGKSFGGIGIYGMHARMTGNVRISVH